MILRALLKSTGRTLLTEAESSIVRELVRQERSRAEAVYAELTSQPHNVWARDAAFKRWQRTDDVRRKLSA